MLLVLSGDNRWWRVGEFGGGHRYDDADVRRLLLVELSDEMSNLESLLLDAYLGAR